MVGCLVPAGGLVKPASVDNDQRVATQHQRLAMHLRHSQRLGLGQRPRHDGRRGVAQIGFKLPLIDMRGQGGKCHTRRRQHRLTRGAFRSQNEPDVWCRIKGYIGHGQIGLLTVGVSLNRLSRSLNRLITAAAVSSIERRVTSITGQPLSANMRRAYWISLETWSALT